MKRETVKIDSKLLQPFREIAGILGISLAECVERELEHRVREIDLENDGLQVIAQQFIADTGYRSRERAEGIAERFEAFAIGAKLDGKPAGSLCCNFEVEDNVRGRRGLTPTATANKLTMK